MKTILFHKLLMVSTVLLIVSGAMAKTVQVGGCLPSLQTYPTISQAVIAVAPGSTILVCPGSYPEQVTITQPLTLRGVQAGNAANPTITPPPGGLTKTVVSANGIAVYYQLLAQGTASGAVNISNIAVDGSNHGVSKGLPVIGVYYQNTSGKLSRTAIHNQIGTGVGYSVLLECTNPSPVAVTVFGSSIHDFDQGGISVDGNVVGSIIANDVVGASAVGSTQPDGIIFYSSGTVAGNRVMSRPQSPQVSIGLGISIQSNATVTNNTVDGFSIGIWPLGNSNKVTSNRVFGGGIVLGGSNNDVEHNHFVRPSDGAGISFNCTGTGNTVIHNVVNDAYWGIVDPHGNTNIIAPNSFSNVAQLISPPC